MRGVLTWAMSELKAEVGASETIDGNRQFNHFTPARAVVVVEDEGAILRDVGLTRTQTDTVLQGEPESACKETNKH